MGDVLADDGDIPLPHPQARQRLQRLGQHEPEGAVRPVPVMQHMVEDVLREPHGAPQHQEVGPVSARYQPETVTAEILLKLLAHNVSRLLTRRRLLCVYFLLPAPSANHAHPEQF
jgi:hypothetical protein